METCYEFITTILLWYLSHQKTMPWMPNTLAPPHSSNPLNMFSKSIKSLVILAKSGFIWSLSMETPKYLSPSDYPDQRPLISNNCDQFLHFDGRWGSSGLKGISLRLQNPSNYFALYVLYWCNLMAENGLGLGQFGGSSFPVWGVVVFSLVCCHCCSSELSTWLRTMKTWTFWRAILSSGKHLGF